MGHTTMDDIMMLDASVDAMKADYNESLDTIWMLICAMLVFFMHAGFSLLESGCVRFKNTQNILAKNLCVITLGFLSWYALGYPIALGVTDSPNKMGGFTNFFADGLWDDKSLFRVWFFQGCFCATGATIVSGAMAERTKLKGFGIYTVIMTSIIYPVVAWWGWSGEGIFNAGGEAITGGPGLIDFAGSGIVHLVGGVGALCGAAVVGPRKGRFEPNHDESFDAHNIPFCVLGTFFLWFGWYGFNPGSTLAMHDAETAYSAGIVAVNTTLAPCVAGLIVFALRAKVLPPKMKDVGAFCNGILGGLVSITAGCGSVKHWEAMVIGGIGGAVYCGASLLLQKLKVDDVVDAFAVHGACGIWGVVALGFFGDPDVGGNGAFYGGNQLGTQLFAILMIILWVGFFSLALFVPLKKIGFLRLSDEFQDVGADVMEHSPSKAYKDNKTEAAPAAPAPAAVAPPAAEPAAETNETNAPAEEGV